MAIDRSRCYSCGKGVAFGNNGSHANNETRRTWKPNLQVARVLDANGKIDQGEGLHPLPCRGQDQACTARRRRGVMTARSGGDERRGAYSSSPFF